jgi:hypothetical protein
MKAVRILVALCSLVLAACGDGSIKSPDFEPLITLLSMQIQPAVVGQGTSIPAGGTLSFRVIGHYSETVQPGTVDTNGNPVTEQLRDEDVTDRAAWTSANPAVATVSQGVVTGVAQSANPVVITASLDGKSDTVSVTVTAATLSSIEYIKPIPAVRDPANQYSMLNGNTLPFEMYGRFSDSQVRKLDETMFTIVWTSSVPAVANNPNGDNNFTAASLGATVIRGEVQNTSASPNFATAGLTVKAVNAFCEREFLAPSAKVATAASQFCIGCTVGNPELAIDGDLTTDADLNITLGLLLQSNVSLTASDVTAPLTVGKPTGFVISRDKGILSAQLLDTITITTQVCNAAGTTCTDVQTFDGPSETLHLELLGLLGNDAQFLVSTAPLAQAANGIKLTFDGGLVSALATLHAQTACAVAVAPP